MCPRKTRGVGQVVLRITGTFRRSGPWSFLAGRGGGGEDMVISTQDDCQRDDNLEPLAQPWVKCQPLIFTTNRGGGGVVIVT